MRHHILSLAAATALTLALSACNQPEEAYEPIDDAAQPADPAPMSEPAPTDPMTPTPTDPAMPPTTDPTMPPTDDPMQTPPTSPEVPPTTDPAPPPPPTS